MIYFGMPWKNANALSWAMAAVSLVNGFSWNQIYLYRL